MSLPEQFTTITQETIIPQIFDQSSVEPSLFNYVMSSAEKKPGGTNIKVPVKTSNDTQGGSYAPNAVFTTNMPNTRTSFEFDWTFHQQPIVVANPYVAMSGGSKEQILSVLGEATEEAWTDFREMVSNQLVGAGLGTDLLGLQALIDDGTRVASYGGKTRSTDTYAQANYTGSVGTLAQADMQQAYRDCERLGEAPDMIWTHTEVRDAYEDIVLPTLQNNVNVNKITAQKPTESKGMQMFMDYGSSLLSYKGVPIFTDNHIASDAMYFWNKKYMKFYVLPNKVYTGTKEYGVTFRPMDAPINQDAQVGYFMIYGQWVNHKPDATACLDGIS